MEVETILDSRMRNRQLQYLVKWKDLPVDENSWEPDRHLTNAPERVWEFHDRHPEAPWRIKAALFDKLLWQPLLNYTLMDKKVQIQRILRSRDLAP